VARGAQPMEASTNKTVSRPPVKRAKEQLQQQSNNNSGANNGGATDNGPDCPYQTSQQIAASALQQTNPAQIDHDSDGPFDPQCGQPDPGNLSSDADSGDDGQQQHVDVIPTNQFKTATQWMTEQQAAEAAQKAAEPAAKKRRAPAAKKEVPPPEVVEPELPPQPVAQLSYETAKPIEVEYDQSDIRNKTCVERNFSQSLLALQSAPLPIYQPNSTEYNGKIRIKPVAIKWTLEEKTETMDGEIRWKAIGYGATQIQRGPVTSYTLTKEKVDGYFISRDYKDQSAGIDPQTGQPTMAVTLDPLKNRFQYPVISASMPITPSASSKKSAPRAPNK